MDFEPIAREFLLYFIEPSLQHEMLDELIVELTEGACLRSANDDEIPQKTRTNSLTEIAS
jgi:hypothetical protein